MLGFSSTTPPEATSCLCFLFLETKRKSDLLCLKIIAMRIISVISKINSIMDIIAIESKTFEQMKERFKIFSNQVKDLCGDNQDKEQWLGNEDVCSLLQISKRTLQSYRDNDILPFSQIGRKCYYKVSDVEQLINRSKKESR